jgi:hypothetical protein
LCKQGDADQASDLFRDMKTHYYFWGYFEVLSVSKRFQKICLMKFLKLFRVAQDFLSLEKIYYKTTIDFNDRINLYE